jgi:hypothetical protein
MAIRELLLLGLCACSDGVDYPGGPPVHHDVTITDPSPPMQLRVESCRVDISACQDLCTAAARANNLFGEVVGCNVTFDSSTTYVGIDLSQIATGGGVP